MQLTITIQCVDVIEAQQVLAQLRGPVPRLDPIDNPETGMNYPDGVVAASVQKASTSLLADVGFGKGTTLPAGAVPLTPAPASAVAAPSATVPAAPSGTPAVPPAATAPAQPTVPAAPAPSASPAAAPVGSVPPAAGVELDATGLPWDKRIHAGTKSKKQDGSWTALRGVDAALKVSVEQELRNLMAMNAAAGTAPAAPAAPPAPDPVAPPPAEVPAAPEAPAAPAAPVGDPTTFSSLMERLTPLMESGKITTDRITAHLQPMKLSGFGQLALAPNLIPQFFASIKPEIQAAEMGL